MIVIQRLSDRVLCAVDIFDDSYGLMRLKITVGLMIILYIFSLEYFIVHRLVKFIAYYAQKKGLGNNNNNNILYSSQREIKAVVRSHTLVHSEEWNCIYLNNSKS